MKQIYSSGYDLHLGNHIFPSIKYRLVKEQLLRENISSAEELQEPDPVADEDVALVHNQDYIRKLKQGKLTYTELMRLEIPYSPELIKAVWLSVGGSVLAGQNALHNQVTANLSGGFHHAYPDHGEGFCVLHDVAIAIRKLQKEGTIERAMVVDCDVHQGNGTAAIFAGDLTVFTLSIHQENIYPYPKPPSSLDVNLAEGTGDTVYLEQLESALLKAFRQFRPNLLFYIAGADPYKEDQLGGLTLTLAGLKARDELVLNKSLGYGVPVAITLAGGYAHRVEDTVQIHCNTVLVAKNLAS